jgi:hypothetical protein
MCPLFVFAKGTKQCTSINAPHKHKEKLTPDTSYANPNAKGKKPSKPPSSISRPGENKPAKQFDSLYKIKND